MSRDLLRAVLLFDHKVRAVLLLPMGPNYKHKNDTTWIPLAKSGSPGEKVDFMAQE